MMEFIFLLLFLLVALHLKNQIEGLRGEIDSLRARLDAVKGKATQTAVTAELPAQIEKETLVALSDSSSPLPVSKKEDSGSFEFKLGSKFFTGVGVVAIICAAGFFLRYAFENDLINEWGRVALGAIAGAILLAVGELTRKKYPNYGQALTGGGLGVLYVSFYAAFSFYQLIVQPAAFLSMIGVTAAGILLSLRQNSMSLAIFAQVGGFLTPLLIDNGAGSPQIPFLYIALLNLAIFLTAFCKLWAPLSLTGIIGTALAYGYWYLNFYTADQFFPALAYASLFFAIFLAISFIQHYVKKAGENAWDLLVVILAPLLYFNAAYPVIDSLYPQLSGPFVAGLGILYCLLAVMAGRARLQSSLFRHFLMSAGFVLLSIAVPIQFDGEWIVVGWAAEALVFISSGFKMNFGAYRLMGNGLLMLTLFKTLFFMESLPLTARPIVNDRFFAYAAFFIAAAGAAYLYRRYRQSANENEKSAFSILTLSAAGMFLFGGSLEIGDFFAGYWYPIFWSAAGLLFAWLSFKVSAGILRPAAYFAFGIAFFRLLFSETSVVLADHNPIFNFRVMAFVVSALLGRAFLSMLIGNKEKISADEYQLFRPALFAYFHILVLWIVSAEIVSACDLAKIGAAKTALREIENLKNVLLSAAWMVYGAVLMVWGIAKKAIYERFSAICLFIIVIAKVFLVDTANLGDLYRFFSFIIMGCVLLFTGYLYYRFQDRIREFIRGK
jgi:uncharacterized membrane protein